MGCGASAPAAAASGGGVASGAFAPFSPQSFATLGHKFTDKKYEALLASSRNGASEVICTGYGVCASKPFHIAIASSNQRLSKYDTVADGARLQLSESNQLGLVFASVLPLNAPCALYTKSAAGICPILVQGACNVVDVYLSVDGAPQTDGHICCGDGGNDNAAAIKNAYKVVPGDMDEVITKILEVGPPGAKPWVTLVNKDRMFEEEHFVFLPLMVRKGDSVDDMIIDECKTYAEGLMAKFATLLGSIGPGEHQFDIRIAPRSVVTTGDHVNLKGHGQYKGSLAKTPEDVISEGDQAFTAFVKSELESQLSTGGLAQQPPSVGRCTAMACRASLDTCVHPHTAHPHTRTRRNRVSRRPRHASLLHSRHRRGPVQWQRAATSCTAVHLLLCR